MFSSAFYFNHPSEQMLPGAIHIATYILEINSEHYDYKAVDPADEDDTAKYQFRLTIPELCELDLENGWKNIFEDPDNMSPLEIAQIHKMTVDKYTDDKFIGDV